MINIGAMIAMQTAIQASTRIACETIRKRSTEESDRDKGKEKK